MFSKLGLKPFEGELALLIQRHHEGPCFQIFNFQSVPVHPQEGCSDSNCCALISIDEGLVLGQAFEKGSRFFNDVPVVTGLRPRQRCFKRGAVPYAPAPPKIAITRACAASVSSIEG